MTAARALQTTVLLLITACSVSAQTQETINIRGRKQVLRPRKLASTSSKPKR